MPQSTRKFFARLTEEHAITSIASVREVLDTINMPTLKAMMGERETSSVGTCYDEIRCDVDHYAKEYPNLSLEEIVNLEIL